MSETIAEGIEDGQRVLTVASINGTPVGANEKLCYVMVDTGSGKQLCLAVKNYGIDDVLRYKGSVATYEDLPSSTAQVGDVWNVLSDGKNYAWTGTAWDDFGGTITISIAAADDVSLSGLANGEVLIYDSSAGKWKNGVMRDSSAAHSLTDIASAGTNITFTTPTIDDYSIAGADVTVTSGIASGFTSSSYIYKEDIWNSIIGSNTSFEYVTKFNLNSLSDDSTLAYIAAGAFEQFVLFVYSNGKVGFRGQTTNANVTMDSGSFYVGTGTDYWVKVSITQSSVVKLSTSTDGVTYTERSSFNINRPFESAAANFAVGCSYTRSGYVVTPKPCLGTIDLTETYFSDGNGNYLWNPISVQSNKRSINAKIKETYTNPALTASGDICTWTVTHTFNSRDVIATVYDTTTYKEIMAEIIHTDATTLTVNITSSSNISAGAYQIVIIG